MRRLIPLLAVVLAACAPATAMRQGRAAAMPIDMLLAAPADEAREALSAEVRAAAATIDAFDRDQRTLADLGRRLAERPAGMPLDGAALEDLHRRFADSLDQVRELARISERHRAWRDHDEADPTLRLTGAGLSLAASCALLDGYLVSGSVLAGDRALRDALNHGDAGWGVGRDQLDALTRDYLDLGTRIGLRAQARLLRSASAAWSAVPGPEAAWLRSRIQASPSRETLEGFWLIGPDESVPGSLGLVASDLRALTDRATATTSQGFGNAVGSVVWRSGRMAGSATVAAAVRARLRPGDIVLEKTPFRLTDHFIPGHFGHAAVWVGSLDDLAGLGLAGDPLVAAQRDALAAGRGMAEALRDGVQLNTLERFLDVDDLCVLRPAGDDRERAEVVRRALRHLGKPYDFAFDVQTTDAIVCSELVYQCWTGIPWATDRTLGRWTISPDQVARRGSDGTLAVVDLWRDGRRVDGDLRAALTALVPVEARR